MTIPNRSEVEQTLASFEGCLPEILNAKYALAGRQLVEWVRELMSKCEALGAEVERLKNESAEVFVNHVAAVKLLGDEIESLKAERDRLIEQNQSEREMFSDEIDRQCERIRAERDRLTAQLAEVQACGERNDAAAVDTIAAQSERIVELEMELRRAKSFADACEGCPTCEVAAGIVSRHITTVIDAARTDASGGIEP